MNAAVRRLLSIAIVDGVAKLEVRCGRHLATLSSAQSVVLPSPKELLDAPRRLKVETMIGDVELERISPTGETLVILVHSETSGAFLIEARDPNHWKSFERYRLLFDSSHEKASFVVLLRVCGNECQELYRFHVPGGEGLRVGENFIQTPGGTLFASLVCESGCWAYTFEMMGCENRLRLRFANGRWTVA